MSTVLYYLGNIFSFDFKEITDSFFLDHRRVKFMELSLNIKKTLLPLILLYVGKRVLILINEDLNKIVEQ